MQGVVVGHGETPGRGDESGVVLDKRTCNWEGNSQFTQGLDGTVHHDTGQDPGNDQGGWTTGGKGGTGTDEQTGTNGTTDSNHLQVSVLQGSLQRSSGGDDVGSLEIGEVRVDVAEVERLETVEEALDARSLFDLVSGKLLMIWVVDGTREGGLHVDYVFFAVVDFVGGHDGDGDEMRREPFTKRLRWAKKPPFISRL